MPEGTYNALTRSGRVVEDPRHAARLGDGDDWLGGDFRGVTVKEAADYLLHRTRNVTLGELSDYYEENGHPDVVSKGTIDGEETTRRYEWDADEADYVPASE